METKKFNCSIKRYDDGTVRVTISENIFEGDPDYVKERLSLMQICIDYVKGQIK
ncbi:MAG: hypothetical protein K5768_04075 [Firmicutes bacterium]|nr:hypothetical protein [Bacillota bacterium]